MAIYFILQNHYVTIIKSHSGEGVKTQNNISENYKALIYMQK